MAWICDKTGQQKCEIKKLSYNGVFMDVSSITVTVESAVPIAFAIGDYIDWDYDGLRYTLDAAAGVEKQARKQTIGNAFVYDNLVFLSPLKAADNAEFLDVIIGNTNEFLTNTEFSFYGTAWDYAKRLEANLCRMYGDGSWKVRIWTGGTCYDETPATGINTGSWENKLVDVSGIKCLGGFQQIYDLWGCAYVFSVNNGVNYVDFYDDFEQYAQAWKESGVDKIFAYGKGNGLYKIRHTQDTDHVLVTRLRPYGSSDNLPANYYLNSPDYHVDGNESSELAISHLMLPASQWTKGGVKSPANAYLEQNTELYGVREASVYWDGSDSELGEIKPTIYGLTIQELLDLMASGTTYRPVEAKWPDTTQRIDKIITGAAPTDNGAVAEAGYDFTVVEASGSTTAHDFGVTRINHDVEFNDLLMGITPSVSHLAEFRIVPTSNNKKIVSFDIPGEIASRVSAVKAYITPYVNGAKVEDATVPCAVSIETISNTVSEVLYTKRCNISLLDATENPIVFSTMLTGSVTFRIRANVVFNGEMSSGFSVIRNEYAVSFNLLRGNKAIDKFFSVTIPQVGFDLAAAVSGAAKLCMRSGYNQPREFQIVASSVRYLSASDTWYLRCKRVVDQSTQTYFPNSDAVIAAGDEYYLAGIAMPSLYVEIAANKLKTAAQAWLSKHSKPRMLSSVDVDNKIMAVEGIVLKEGMSLPLSDVDLGITPQNQESRVIDNIRIEEGSASIRTFSITLRDKKEKSSIDAAIRGATSNFATNTSVSEAVSAVESRDHCSLSGRDMPNQHPITAITGLEEALAALTFFEEDGNGNVKLKDEYGGLWADGFMTAGGIGSGGGGGGEGATLLEVWRSLTNNPSLVDSDITPALAIAAAHIPIGNGLTINPQTGLIDATTSGTVISVAGVSPVNGDVPKDSLIDALGLNIVSRCLQSLQSQIDSVASKDDFDELNVTVLHTDMLSASGIYAEAITLGGSDLSTTLNGLSTAIGNEATARANADSTLASGISTLNGYFTNGAANNAIKLGGQLPSYYATASALGGVSDRLAVLEARQNWDEIFGIDENGDVYIKQYQEGGETKSRGFWGYSFITAGGVGSSGGGGGDVDLPRVWESLTNNTDFPNVTINPAHIPDMANVYGYLKGNQQITLTGVVTGSGATTIATSIANNALSISMVNGLQAALDSKTSNVGTVTSVGLSMPTGFSVSSSPITAYGTLSVSFASGYSLLTSTQISTWNGKQDAIGDLDTIRTNAALGAEANGWGNHASAGYFKASSFTAANIASTLGNTAVNRATSDAYGENISDKFGIVGVALQSLQSQIDSLASKNAFDELSVTVLNADMVTATTAYLETIYGSLQGNALTASYLYSQSYSAGSPVNPVYFTSGRPAPCSYSFGNASGNVPINNGILNTNLWANYATCDSSNENISDKFGIVSVALQSIQSQVDSVASRNSFDELSATVLHADMLTVGAQVNVSGAIFSDEGIYTNGYLVGGGVASSSDRRLKDEITKVDAERAWEVLMALNPVEWVWNENNAHLYGRRSAGLVAQEVFDVLPYSVFHDGQYDALRYDVFHAFEIAGLQDHEARIRTLEAENKELKRQVELLTR